MSLAIAAHHPQSAAPASTGRRASRLRTVLPIVLMIAGAVLLAFPYAANLVIKHMADQAISSQVATVSSMNPAQRQAELAKARAYNDSLTGEPVKDPFIPGSGVAVPSTDVYYDTLNVNGDGVMGVVDIDMINVHLPIGHGTGEDVLQRGVGHVRQTSLPIGGPGTHAVLAGHRGLPTAEMFTRLDEMRVGDTFTITVLNETMTYQVDQINTVLPDDLTQIAVVDDRDLVTLMTCTPYGENTHRLLVRGTRVPNAAAATATHVGMGIDATVRIVTFVASLLIAAVLAISLIRRRRRTNMPTIIRHRGS